MEWDMRARLRSFVNSADSGDFKRRRSMITAGKETLFYFIAARINVLAARLEQISDLVLLLVVERR